MRGTMPRSTQEYQKDAVYASVIFLIVCLLVRSVEPYFLNNTDKETSIARTLMDKAKHWYTVSLQDRNSQIKTQHAAFASAYLDASRHIMNDATLEQISQMDVHELYTSIETQKKSAQRDVMKQCPKLKVVPTTNVPSRVPTLSW